MSASTLAGSDDVQDLANATQSAKRFTDAGRASFAGGSTHYGHVLLG
jgi:hypothetical protein